MKELEKRGVPTVGLVSDDFIEDYIRSATSFGIPELKYAHLADPLVSQTPEAIRTLIDDAMQGVLSGLLATQDASGEEERPEARDVVLKREPWFTFTGSDLLAAAHAMNEQFLEWQYGDGFPLLPATRKQVDYVLSGTTRDRDEIIGLMEPGDGVATVEKIAINAAMAGCQPKHLPIVIAAVECMVDYHMDLREKAISTGPAAPDPNSVELTARRVDSAATSDEARKLVDNFMVASVELRRTATQVRQLSARLEATEARLDDFLASGDSVLRKIDRGQGTLGLLVNDPSMYRRTDSVLAELRALVADVRNNPKKYISVRLF